MARTSTGIDVGTATAVAIKGQFKGGTFHVSGFEIEAPEASSIEDGWGALAPGFTLTPARVGLTGREVNLRYVRVPRVPDWQLRKLMRFEVEDIGGQSDSAVASDFNLLPELPEIEGEDVVVLAMAKDSLLDEHLAGLAGMGCKLEAFAPAALGLYNAWMRYGVIEGDTVMIANIGRENIDVVIARGPDLLFARNLSGGSLLFDQAIAQQFNISVPRAEEVKLKYATLAPGARFENPNQEKASRAIAGAAGQLQSLLQSTVMFCKSQLKIGGLKIDRVVLCGGGAALTGLPQWLENAMGVPTELFDCVRVLDTSNLEPEAADNLEEYKLEAVVALGLATMASDPDAYSIEILPEGLRQRRDFWSGTAFLVASALLGILFLGYDAWSTSRELQLVEQQVSKLTRDVKRAKKTDAATVELIERNALLEATALELQGLLGSGEQLVRVLEVLDQRMPEEFWISNMESSWSFDEELSIHRTVERPILRLAGRARQGTRSMASLYEGFLASLRDNLDGIKMKAAPNADGSRFELDLSLLAVTQPELDDVDQDAEEGR
ncbi:MAG: pilus assembly protein PilM [bacterium]|jgi:Tfp pilus assembly PilM family ATPase|nr:hypothetical protein [Planctomycetota bacterium]HIL51935.1 hypothetical protein [Planctomycetota bacterium]